MVILESKILTKEFGGMAALDEVDLDVYQGEILGLIGPNGSGKTTWINVVAGILKPTKGHVTCKGETISGLKPHQIAQRGVLRTFQLTSLFADLTVEANVRIGRQLKRTDTIWGSLFNTRGYREAERKLGQKVSEILTYTNLQDKKGVLAKNLPYGDQRLLEIAIALAADPELLMLDEPAAGMNPEEAAELVHLIRSLQQMGITIVLVEHNMRVIMNICNRIAVLNYGKKIVEGTPEELIKNKEVISVYLGERHDAQG